jgi:hypothetical protein
VIAAFVGAAILAAAFVFAFFGGYWVELWESRRND